MNFKNGYILVGDKNKISIFVLSPSEKVLGTKYGLELVDYLIHNDKTAIVSDMIVEKRTYGSVLISDEFDFNTLQEVEAKKYVFLNAQFLYDEKFVQFLKDKNTKAEIIVVLGDISDWRNKEAWKDFSEMNPNVKFKILQGVSFYIPEWTEYLND